jgi:hypothetical protein
MAFLDFHQAPATGLAPFTRPAPRPVSAAAPLFDRIERQVLILARGDRSSSLRVSPLLDGLLGRLFGTSRPNRLADPRLEALRRLAVTARLRGARAVAAETRRFLAAGFTTAHAAAVLRWDRPS